MLNKTRNLFFNAVPRPWHRAKRTVKIEHLLCFFKKDFLSMQRIPKVKFIVLLFLVHSFDKRTIPLATVFVALSFLSCGLETSEEDASESGVTGSCVQLVNEVETCTEFSGADEEAIGEAEERCGASQGTWAKTSCNASFLEKNNCSIEENGVTRTTYSSGLSKESCEGNFTPSSSTEGDDNEGGQARVEVSACEGASKCIEYLKMEERGVQDFERQCTDGLFTKGAACSARFKSDNKCEVTLYPDEDPDFKVVTFSKDLTEATCTGIFKAGTPNTENQFTSANMTGTFRTPCSLVTDLNDTPKYQVMQFLVPAPTSETSGPITVFQHRFAQEDVGCEGEIEFTVKHSGTYSITEGGLSYASRTANLDFTIASSTLEARSSGIVANFNTNSRCGVSSWTLYSETTVANHTDSQCPAPATGFALLDVVNNDTQDILGLTNGFYDIAVGTTRPTTGNGGDIKSDYFKIAIPDSYSACSSCHGSSGAGGIGSALSLTNSTLSSWETIIRDGSGSMPAYTESQISDDDIARLYFYFLIQ